MSDAPYATIGAPRADCFACGNCCYGHRVDLVDDAEIARIQGHAATLGIPDPVTEGELRFEDGGCVFLGSDRLCSIHREYGFTEKPLRCQAWPLKLVRTEGEIRMSVDPGCVSTYRHFDEGPLLEPPEKMVVRDGAIDPGQRSVEMALLRASMEPEATVTTLLHLIGRSAGGEGLPEGMASRIVTRVQATRFRSFITHPEFGWGIRDPLDHMADAIESWDRGAPPEWSGLSPKMDAYALDTFRRKLFMREAPEQPKIMGDALLTLTGIVACAWADPRPEVFGPALAAWTRLLRFRAFWLRLVPEPHILEWLGTGVYQGPLKPDIVIGSDTGSS